MGLGLHVLLHFFWQAPFLVVEIILKCSIILDLVTFECALKLLGCIAFLILIKHVEHVTDRNAKQKTVKASTLTLLY